MPKRTGKKLDLKQLAAKIIHYATDETSIPIPTRNPDAINSGKARLKDGKASDKKLSPKKRKRP
jgi:hypothetical protein